MNHTWKLNLSYISSFMSGSDLDRQPSYKASVIIWKVVPPILILLGTAGNSLSILVLTRKSIRTSTTALYLTVLAFSDLTVLYTGLFRQWMVHAFGIDVREFSDTGCKINIWLVYSSLDFSAWILIVVTLERVISVWFPHRAKHACTKLNAIVCLVAIGVFILLLNSHLLYGMGFIHTGSIVDKCVEYNDDYYYFFNKTWPWIDLCGYCLIPFFVIVTGNTLILIKIVQSKNKVKSRTRTLTTGTRRKRSLSGKNSYMTAVLLTINIFFLVSTTPISVYNIGYVYWFDHDDVETVAKLDLWWAIVNMLMYANNTFNFILYCLSGSQFRQEVIRMRCSGKPVANFTTLQTPNVRIAI